MRGADARRAQVVHVATAAVLTNFAYAAAPRPLAPTSRYTKVRKFVEARARLSQSGAISPEQFAPQLVGATLGRRSLVRARPPRPRGHLAEARGAR